MNRSTPGLPVHHQLPEFTQTHVHRVGDAIHPLSSPLPPAPNPSQHQSLFQWVLWPPHAEELIHWKSLWCGEGLGAGEEGGDRGWDGWMASPTRWTWVWVNSGSWWWTGRPGVLRFMELLRVGHDWATELIWTEGNAAALWPLLGQQRKILCGWQFIFTRTEGL